MTVRADLRERSGRYLCSIPSIGRNVMSLGTILLIVIVIALLGGFSGLGGGPFYGTGYYGGGGLGLGLVIADSGFARQTLN